MMEYLMHWITISAQERTVIESDNMIHIFYMVLSQITIDNHSPEETDALNFLFEIKESNFSYNFKKPISASFPQKILIASYAHLYGALTKRNLINDENLKKIREFLDIEDNFALLALKQLQSANPLQILREQSPLLSVIQPNSYTVGVINKLVYNSSVECCCKKKINIAHLDSREYEHPFDRSALIALESTPGLKKATEIISKHALDIFKNIQIKGSNYKVTRDSIPDIYNIFEQACNTLNLDKIPDIYMENGFINARTIGVDRPIVILNTGCIGLLSHDELLFIIGHELGHIKSNHVLYHQLPDFIPYITDIFSSVTLGISDLASGGLRFALLNWQRMSEYSSDRAGLLCCQNVDAAVTAMMKLAGYPIKYYKTIKPENFIIQAREFEGIDTEKIGKIAKYASLMFADHPWTVMRAKELVNWVESGEYEKVLMRGQRDSQKTCSKCGSEIKDNCKFCQECGQKVLAIAQEIIQNTCSNCGTEIKGNYKFCKNCGSKIL